MGRMNPAPLEATAGSSEAAVNQQWWKHLQAERAGLTEKERESQARLHAATAWVAEQPGLCVNGEPCGYAVWAALDVRRHDPGLKGEEFAHQVQVRRARLLSAASFTPTEIAQILAGRFDWTAA